MHLGSAATCALRHIKCSTRRIPKPRKQPLSRTRVRVVSTHKRLPRSPAVAETAVPHDFKIRQVARRQFNQPQRLPIRPPPWHRIWFVSRTQCPAYATVGRLQPRSESDKRGPRRIRNGKYRADSWRRRRGGRARYLRPSPQWTISGRRAAKIPAPCTSVAR
jgi:hypothetical protein